MFEGTSIKKTEGPGRSEQLVIQVIRTHLAERYAPSNANKMLSALRGTLKAAFNLDLMNADQLARATAVKAVRGSRVPQDVRFTPANFGCSSGGHASPVRSSMYDRGGERAKLKAAEALHVPFG